jgi:hypothetical protein
MDLHAGAGRNTGADRDGDLNGIARFDVEAMKLRCRKSGERGAGRKPLPRCPKAIHRVGMKSRVDIDRGPNASPARAAQVPPVESGSLSFLDSERTAEKRSGQVGLACHRALQQTAERRRSH